MDYLWFHIAKNELRIWTSRFRNHRKLLLIILTAFLGVYAFVLVPLIFNSFADQVTPVLASFGYSLPYFLYFIISFIVLYIFMWCLTYPMSMTLQNTSDLSGQLEILLGTPLKTHDYLFGKFLGRIPTYLILLFLLGPWIVNFLNLALPALPEPLPPLNVFGQILIYLVLFLIVIFGMWVGNLIAAYAESRVRKSERSRDLGKAMTFLITIFTVIIMYVLMWVMFSGLSDPTSPLYSILKGFPSTWGAIIIINIFGLGYAIGANVALYIILLIGCTLGSFYFGYHLAARFYSLEPIEKSTAQITEEKGLYRWFRKLMPGPFGIQFITQLKQYSRKLENFSRIAYAIGISIIVIVFNMISFGGSEPYWPVIFFMVTFFYPMMMSGLLGTYVIIGSKDSLWIYKKAPNGVRNYVRAVYLVNIFYTLIIGIIFSTVASILLPFTVLDAILAVLLNIMFVLTLMAMAIGIAFIFPTFEERGGKVGILMGSFMGITVGTWTGCIFISAIFFDDALLAAPIITLIFTTILGLTLLKLGIKKLSSLE